MKHNILLYNNNIPFTVAIQHLAAAVVRIKKSGQGRSLVSNKNKNNNKHPPLPTIAGSVLLTIFMIDNAM
jgi:hypothetical protein